MNSFFHAFLQVRYGFANVLHYKSITHSIFQRAGGILVSVFHNGNLDSSMAYSSTVMSQAFLASSAKGLIINTEESV